MKFKNDKQRKAVMASISQRDVVKANRERMPRSMNMDAIRTAVNTFKITDADGRAKWIEAPNRFDIEGLDDKRPVGKRIRESEFEQDDIEGKRIQAEGLKEFDPSKLEDFTDEWLEQEKPWHEDLYLQYPDDVDEWMQHQSEIGKREADIQKALEGEPGGDMPSIGDKIALQSGADGKLISISDTHMEIEQKVRAGDTLKTEILKVPLKDTIFVKRKDGDKWDLKIDYGEPPATKQTDKSITDFKVDPSLINKDLAMRAHHGTSFDPELRGKQEIESFEIEMNRAYETLSKRAKTPEQKAILNEEMTTFQENYAKKQNELLSSKSRILSPKITGPANFPTRRNQKANDAYHNKYGQFMEWESKTLGSIGRKMERHEKQKHIESAGGEVALMKQNLKNLENRQEEMKNTNKIIRKKIPEDEKIKHLEDIGIKSGMGKLLIETGGYETYQMSNNNANIKRMKERVIEMEKRESTPTSTIKFTGGEIIDNNKDERVQIFFEDKPDEDMRKKMKGEGWRWAPSTGAWQRKRTDAALYSAKRLTGV